MVRTQGAAQLLNTPRPTLHLRGDEMRFDQAMDTGVRRECVVGRSLRSDVAARSTERRRR
jgi:hypothetical protein